MIEEANIAKNMVGYLMYLSIDDHTQESKPV